MSLTFVEVYAAYEVHDEYGRNKSLIGVCRTAEEAEVLVKGKGWWGGPGMWVKMRAIEDGLDLYLLSYREALCFQDVSELREKQRKEKIDAIKAKLTKEELELLKGEL